MSPYTEGIEALARDILEILNSPLSDEARLIRIRTIVTEQLPSPAPEPWVDSGSGPGHYSTAWERHDDPEENR